MSCSINSVSATIYKSPLTYPRRLLYYYKCDANDIVNNKLANYANTTVAYDATVNLATLSTAAPRNSSPSSLYFNNTQFTTTTVRPSTAYWVTLPPTNTRLSGINNNGITISIWMHPTDVSNRNGQAVLSMNNDSFSIGIYGSLVEFYLGGNNFRPVAYLQNAWNHIVVRIGPLNQTTVFVNNVQYSYTQRSVSFAYNPTCDTNLASLGTANWLGYIDDVRIYNYALEAADITTLYNS